MNRTIIQSRIADESLECAPEVRLIDLVFCLEGLAEQLDLVLGEVRWRAQPSAVEAGVPGCGATPAVGEFVFGVTPGQFDALDRLIHTISAQGDAVAASHMADLARPTLPVLGQAIFDGAATLAELLAQVHEQRLDSRSGVAEPRARYGGLVDACGAARRDIIGLLWQDLVRSKQLAQGKRLPPVFPLVIYNGRPRWSAPQLLQPLMAMPDDGVPSGYQPQFRYFLFDEGQVAPEQAERADNAVSHLLALEASRDLETLQREIARLRARLAAPEHDSLRRAFTVWIHRVALRRMIPGQEVPRTETLEETETMLAERVTEWTREWKREGLEQGLEQGREQGRLEGERATVQRLLTRRFGPLPEAALARLGAADAETLGLWAERLLDAPSLDEVFQTLY